MDEALNYWPLWGEMRCVSESYVPTLPNRFQEIDRFNAYAQSNAASVAGMFADVKGLEDIVKVAKNLKFDFSLDDVKAYIRERTKRNLTEEQLAMVVGGSSWTYTYSWTIAWTLAVAAIQVDIAAEVVTIAVIAVVAVAVVL